MRENERMFRTVGGRRLFERSWLPDAYGLLLSVDARLDDSYVSRLLKGERVSPSRDPIILLGGWGLELPVEDVDELLLSANHRPLVLPATLS